MAVAVRRSPLDLERFALGGATPLRAYEPRSIDQLAAAMRATDAAGEALVLFGGGTLQGFGALPARYDLAISLRRLAATVSHEPRDGTISLLAGMTLGQLERVLAEAGRFVPFDAPRPLRGTVGGALAAGWLGPRRATYGRPSDHVLGTTLVLADGTIASTGGTTLRGSAGYDVGRLVAGSLGTLAAIARVTLRTRPLPARRRLAIAPLPERTRTRAARHLAVLAIEPTAALLVRGFDAEIAGHDDLEGRAFVFFEGSEGTVERATRELRSSLGAAGVPETRLFDRDAAETFARAMDAYVASVEERSVTYRSLGRPSDVETRGRRLEELAHDYGLQSESIFDLRTGDAVVRVVGNDELRFATAIVPFDDAAHDALPATIVLAAPALVRERLNVWGAPSPGLTVMRRLKEQFDPRATLAPGRFVAGI
ncbi:MAG: FAD-binding oxidoreductase [Candidatus Baltobacteraceae bacterium]